MTTHLDQKKLSAAATKNALVNWFGAEPEARYSIIRPSEKVDVLLVQTVKDAEQSRGWAEEPEMQSWQKYGAWYKSALPANDVVRALDEMLEEGTRYSVETETSARFRVEPHYEPRFVNGLAVRHFFFNSLYPQRVAVGPDGVAFTNLFMHLKRSTSREESPKTLQYRIIDEEGKTVTQNQLCDLSFATGKTDCYVSAKISFKLNELGTFNLEVALPGLETSLYTHHFTVAREQHKGDPSTLKELAAQRSEHRCKDE